MEKVIFLDIDGVLNDNCINVFLDLCVQNVKTIIEKEKAKVVVISSLQGNGTCAKRKVLSERLNKVDIIVDSYIDPNFKGDMDGISISSRAIGIVDYLKKNKDCCYVILDDEYDEEYALLGLNYFKTGMWQGLQKEEVEAITFKKVDFKTLNGINYCYRELGAYELAANNLVKTLHKVLELKEKSL